MKTRVCTYLAIVLLTAVLASCALVPATQPQTLGQALVAAEVTATAAMDATTALVTSGAVPPAAARAIGDSAELVFLAVRAARAALGRGDAAGAQAQLEAITGDLRYLERAIRREP